MDESHITSRCKTHKTSRWREKILMQRFISVENQISVKTESELTHLFRLFWVSARLLFRLLVCFVNLGVHAVHALCPLSINHFVLLLTGSKAKKKACSVRRKLITEDRRRRCGPALPSVLDMTLDPVQLFPKHSTRFEVQHTLIPSAGELKAHVNQ